MFAFFLYFSASAEPISIFDPTYTIEEDSKEIDISDRYGILHFFFPFVGSEKANNLADKITYTKSTSTNFVEFGPESGRAPTRSFKRFNTLISIKKVDKKVIAKVIKITTNCYVNSVVSRKVSPYTWRPLTGDEVTQVYNKIDSTVKPALQAAIKKIKE